MQLISRLFSRQATIPLINGAKAMHREELVDMPTTCINLDAAVLGAGSNACGPLPNKNDRVGSLNGKKLSFTIQPIGD